MAVFAYHVLDARQRPRRGVITADSAPLARQALRAQGLAIVEIAPAAARRWGAWRRRNPEALAEVWRSVALLLRAGLPLSDALDVCVRQQKGPLATVLRQAREAVRGGQAFAQALTAQPDWFDPLTRLLVQVGEQSGSLAEALAELAEYQARRRSLLNRLQTALLYPALLCVIGTGVVVFLMSQVVPQLLEVLTAAGRDLPGPTKVLKGVSDLFLQHGLWLALGVGGVIAAGAMLRQTLRGRRALERLTLNIPFLGDLLRKAWVARISLTLATLLKSDVRFVEALRTVRRHLPHRLYAEELEQLEKAVEAGSDLATPLRTSRLLPPLAARLLAVGQESGELPQMLAQLRDGYEKEVQLALTRLLAVLEPALIVILAAVIGFVVYATLLPILETTRMVS